MLRTNHTIRQCDSISRRDVFYLHSFIHRLTVFLSIFSHLDIACFQETAELQTLPAAASAAAEPESSRSSDARSPAVFTPFRRRSRTSLDPHSSSSSASSLPCSPGADDVKVTVPSVVVSRQLELELADRVDARIADAGLLGAAELVTSDGASSTLGTPISPDAETASLDRPLLVIPPTTMTAAGQIEFGPDVS